ncbi:nonstructural protein [Bulbul coronavirus HKU11]|uniref:Nonstructural protein n=1 Tax=Bulbul coronavirus HKU11 TaxID=574549 RepID=B6VDW7_9NIDO|nr:nonstructural protein [Bulbul coronavirus HKU11-934]ACJ12042.1 nonstructural protein [Bulbul coronavirus HKU11-934]
MISIGYYLITFFTMLFWRIKNPRIAELLGPLLDLEILGFLTLVFYYWNFRPRRFQQIIKPESQSEGATMQTRAGYSCTESPFYNNQCKKGYYTI